MDVESGFLNSVKSVEGFGYENFVEFIFTYFRYGIVSSKVGDETRGIFKRFTLYFCTVDAVFVNFQPYKEASIKILGQGEKTV